MNNCYNPNFPPFIPEKPCVPCGCFSVEEQILMLNKKVNTCIETYNNVMNECYKTLDNLIDAGKVNEAYYDKGEVWIENGYDSISGANYTIIRKAQIDKKGCPIEVNLKLAYNNTTNSQIEENIFNASKIEFADKIVSAMPITGTGWYGLTIYNGAPIPSTTTNTETAGFTVGFTKTGVMKVYPNSANISTLQNDGIYNSMGCSGVIINDGIITDGNWITGIPNRTIASARIAMGYNSTTNQVIFLVVGDSDSNSPDGMTTAQVASVLLGYGCTVAVELCEGKDCGALDKGSNLFAFRDNIPPNLYCYWYISRAKYYTDNYTKDLAELTQNYGQILFQGSLNANQITNISNEIDNITTELQDTQDVSNQAALNASNALSKVITLETTVNSMETDVTKLNDDYAAVVSALNSTTGLVNSIIDGTADIAYVKTNGNSTIIGNITQTGNYILKGGLEITNTTGTVSANFMNDGIQLNTNSNITGLRPSYSGATLSTDMAISWGQLNSGWATSQSNDAIFKLCDSGIMFSVNNSSGAGSNSITYAFYAPFLNMIIDQIEANTNLTIIPNFTFYRLLTLWDDTSSQNMKMTFNFNTTAANIVITPQTGTVITVSKIMINEMLPLPVAVN